MATEEVEMQPGDSSRVDVHNRHELPYWMKRFGVSEQQLRAAVNKVGVIIDDVERELKGSASAGQSDG
jgi:hypothetical protein